MDNRYYIFILSDSLGETASHVARAAMNQFLNKDYVVKKYNYVRDTESVEEIVLEASKHKSMILFTTVLEEMTNTIVRLCEQHQVLYHDILSPVLTQFTSFFDEKPVI